MDIYFKFWLYLKFYGDFSMPSCYHFLSRHCHSYSIFEWVLSFTMCCSVTTFIVSNFELLVSSPLQST